MASCYIQANVARSTPTFGFMNLCWQNCVIAPVSAPAPINANTDSVEIIEDQVIPDAEEICPVIIVNEIFPPDNKPEPRQNRHFIKLNGRALSERLKKLRYWFKVDPQYPSIKREIIFPNNSIALDFVNSISDISKMLGHYPKITVYYCKVLLSLRTNEVNGISDKDIELAECINSLKM